MTRQERLLELAQRLERWGAERCWSGTDPYEGLNATRLVVPLRRSPLGRRLVIQAVKRSPVDLRPLLGIPPGLNAAAVAWVVSSYARDGFLPSDEARRKLEHALSLLESLRCADYREPCWGYHFDFQSRVLFFSKATPNGIATAFAGGALLDAHEGSGDPSLLQEARQTGRFFLRHVAQTETDDGAFFGYVPGDSSPIHNSNMLVAALLARLAATYQGEDNEFLAPAEAALRYTLARQRDDGSWPYGERSDVGWIDNFHTGYVLEALRTCADSGLGGMEASEAWERGMSFYGRELFLSDGTPKYRSSSTYPIDAQCVAQGIQTFAIASRYDRSYSELAWKVLDFALTRMRRSDGLLVFQRRRLWTNRIPHVRWVVAPTLLALTHLLSAERASGS